MNLFESVRRRPWVWILPLVAILISVAVVALFALSSLPVQVDSISLDRSELTFSSFSQTHQLIPTTQPSDISYRSLTWTSSDPSVATVSSSGYVTPVGNGGALITGQRAK